MAHTPGEWTIERRGLEDEFPNIKGSNHATVAVVTLRAYDENANDATEANALLIAAAPDLLETLTHIVEAEDRMWGMGQSEFDALMDDAKAAIAKAKAN